MPVESEPRKVLKGCNSFSQQYLPKGGIVVVLDGTWEVSLLFQTTRE